MSLRIDVDTVTKVLLADGWHVVADASFDLDSYEYEWSGVNNTTVDEARKMPSDRFDRGYFEPINVHGGGNSGVCATGFGFVNEFGSKIYGPLTAILAVTTERKRS